MKNIILILSFILCLLNPMIVKAQPLSQKEKIEVSQVIASFVPDVYNNRYTPCLLKEIYSKLEGENGLTQEDRMFILKEQHPIEASDESLYLLDKGFGIINKIIDISKEVVKSSSCYSK